MSTPSRAPQQRAAASARHRRPPGDRHPQADRRPPGDRHPQADRHPHGDRGSPGAALAGQAGNERLTAMSGALLLPLFAAEGLTILSVRQLLTMHFFLGMLLIGPVALKIAATAYRFVRYYTGATAYVAKGPPAPLMRLLGPLVIITSVAVIGTGTALAVTGPQRGIWLLAHKASFVLWFGVMTIHVLVYAPRLPRLLSGQYRGRARAVLAGRTTRWLLIAASVAGGLVIAVLTLHLAGRWGASVVTGSQPAIRGPAR